MAPNAVYAPYNFVPLSQTVVFPEWGDLVGHDRPFEDGMSGAFDIEITAETPIVVGGGASRRPKVSNAPSSGEWNSVQFFTDPDGHPAIPGSTLRGVIRNVVEIAAFSRMSIVDDRRFGVRDLTQGGKVFYGSRMTARVNTRGEASNVAKVHAGFLRFVSGIGWQIVPCRYGRIQHDTLHELGRYAVPREEQRRERRVPKYMGKFQLARMNEFGLLIDPDVRVRVHSHRRGQLNLSYAEFGRDHVALVGESVPDRAIPGTLVITGQVPGKHMEFIFYDLSGSFSRPPVAVPKAAIEAFLAIHADQEADEEAPWGYWHKRLIKERTIGPGTPLEKVLPGMPVFYLAADGAGASVQALGLSQMFKLPYDLSVKEVMDHTSSEHRAPEKHGRHALDMSELLFGTVSKVPGRSLKGRVSFGLARISGSDPSPTLQPAVVLNSPKPSYYPFYIRQSPLNRDPVNGDIVEQNVNGPRGAGYKSYTLAGRQARRSEDLPEIAGWKRYLPRTAPSLDRPVGDEQRKVATRLTTLPVGTRFRTRVTFHNLRPPELGALLWSICLGAGGERSSGFHLLGSGKPYGFGRTRWEIGDVELRPNKLRGDVEEVLTKQTASNLIDDCVMQFENYMEKQLKRSAAVGSWRGCEQIRALREMADVDAMKVFTDAHEPYLFLQTSLGQANRFQAAKGRKEDRSGPALPSRTLPRVVPADDAVSPPQAAVDGPVSLPPDWLIKT